MGKGYCFFAKELFDHFLGGAFPLPDGTKYVSASPHREDPRVMVVIIENDIIPNVPQGDPLPEYILIIETDQDGKIIRRELKAGA